MSFRRTVALLLLGALVSLTILADARPPDPVWVTGVYDDADFDDVVALILSAQGLAAPLTASAPCCLIALPVEPGRVARPRLASTDAPHSVRAPPPHRSVFIPGCFT